MTPFELAVKTAEHIIGLIPALKDKPAPSPLMIKALDAVLVQLETIGVAKNATIEQAIAAARAALTEIGGTTDATESSAP